VLSVSVVSAFEQWSYSRPKRANPRIQPTALRAAADAQAVGRLTTRNLFEAKGNNYMESALISAIVTIIGLAIGFVQCGSTTK